MSERLTDAELDMLARLVAEAATWVEDQEPDGDEEGPSGEFFVPAPWEECSDTVRYIGRSEINGFVLAARSALPKLLAEVREERVAAGALRARKIERLITDPSPEEVLGLTIAAADEMERSLRLAPGTALATGKVSTVQVYAILRALGKNE